MINEIWLKHNDSIFLQILGLMEERILVKVREIYIYIDNVQCRVTILIHVTISPKIVSTLITDMTASEKMAIQIMKIISALV